MYCISLVKMLQLDKYDLSIEETEVREAVVLFSPAVLLQSFIKRIGTAIYLWECDQHSVAIRCKGRVLSSNVVLCYVVLIELAGLGCR